MDRKSKIEEIKNLFSKNKFQETIDKINELCKPEARPADLSCLSGVCKIIKSDPTEDEILSALSDFEDAYYKEKNSNIGLESVCNFISTCILHSINYPKLFEYFLKAKQIYDDAEKKFSNNEKFCIAGLKLHKLILDYDKMREINSVLINNNTKHLTSLCRWAFINNYSYKWSQKDYFNFANALKKAFPSYETKTVDNLSFKNGKKIKVGFVSCNFNSGHSITYFMKDIIKNMDKDKFETHAFDLGRYGKHNQPISEFKDRFDFWYELNDRSNQEVINIIQKNNIEILFDVMSITHPERIGIFNNRVSPLQISWLAYCNTIGFDKIDYLIADTNLIKENEEKYYTEKIIKLSNIWSTHSGFDLGRNYQESPLLKNKYITFGSFNNFMKISNEVIDTWSKILKKVNNSRLILKSSEKYNYKILMGKFEKYGVDHMVQVLDKKNFDKTEDHLNLYNKIDIALDTFPYTGVTTTFEALWKGVPVVSLKGHNFKSRCGESILKNANLDFLICSNKNEYIKKVYDLSNDTNRLIEIRKDIFNNILETDLFNNKKYVFQFEKILLQKYKYI